MENTVIQFPVGRKARGKKIDAVLLDIARWLVEFDGIDIDDDDDWWQDTPPPEPLLRAICAVLIDKHPDMDPEDIWEAIQPVVGQ